MHDDETNVDTLGRRHIPTHWCWCRPTVYFTTTLGSTVYAHQGFAPLTPEEEAATIATLIEHEEHHIQENAKRHGASDGQ